MAHVVYVWQRKVSDARYITVQELTAFLAHALRLRRHCTSITRYYTQLYRIYQLDASYAL